MKLAVKQILIMDKIDTSKVKSLENIGTSDRKSAALASSSAVVVTFSAFK